MVISQIKRLPPEGRKKTRVSMDWEELEEEEEEELKCLKELMQFRR